MVPQSAKGKLADTVQPHKAAKIEESIGSAETLQLTANESESKTDRSYGAKKENAHGSILCGDDMAEVGDL